MSGQDDKRIIDFALAKKRYQSAKKKNLHNAKRSQKPDSGRWQAFRFRWQEPLRWMQLIFFLMLTAYVLRQCHF